MSVPTDARFLQSVGLLQEALGAFAKHHKTFSSFRDNKGLYQIPEINAGYLYKDDMGDVYARKEFLELWDEDSRLIDIMLPALGVHCAMVDLTQARGVVKPGVSSILSQRGIYIQNRRKLDGTYNFNIFHKRDPLFELLAYSDNSGVSDLIRGEANEPVEPEEVPVDEEVMEYTAPPMYEQVRFIEDIRILGAAPRFADMQAKLFPLAQRREQTHYFYDSLIRPEHLNADGTEFNPVFLNEIKDNRRRDIVLASLRLSKFFHEYGQDDECVVSPQFVTMVVEHKHRIEIEQTERGFFVRVYTGNGWVYIKSDAVVRGKGYIQKVDKPESIWKPVKREFMPIRVYQTNM